MAEHKNWGTYYGLRHLKIESQRKPQAMRCPHIIRKLAGDETYDICELNTKSCLIEHGLYECETWDEIKKEWENEGDKV